MGDTVNLSSRIESANKEFKTEILISEETRRQAGEGFKTKAMKEIKVKGKAAVVQLYELIDQEKSFASKGDRD